VSNEEDSLEARGTSCDVVLAWEGGHRFHLCVV
jgi:hypothetical protein